jgi:hypothetical protein
MQTLRHFTRITRLVLAWFVLSLGVAAASPIVKPQDALVVCTGTGAMKVLVQSDDGSTTEQMHSGMDCPLCATLGAPPPAVTTGAQPVQVGSYALPGIPGVPMAARSAAPLPARGPPSFI